MNEKEISEIRRRFRPDKSNISRIRGCYVNESREIISEFNESLGMMTPEESEEILTILKKSTFRHHRKKFDRHRIFYRTGIGSARA